MLGDISYDTLLHVVEYLYTNDTSVTHENCVNLLSASNRFQITGLKFLVEKTIAENIEHDNVANLLRYADFYNATNLYNVWIN